VAHIVFCSGGQGVMILSIVDGVAVCVVCVVCAFTNMEDDDDDDDVVVMMMSSPAMKEAIVVVNGVKGFMFDLSLFVVDMYYSCFSRLP